MAERITKARYWWAVLWVENLEDGWRDKIDDTIQVPFAYCVHGKDTDTKSEHRKDHVHLLLAFPNTTTYQHALKVFKLLGPKAVNSCQAVVNIRHAYDYLIHDTDSCRKQGKHQYGPEERVEGNNFDIGMYEQLSIADKQEMLKELVGYLIVHEEITTINEATVSILQEFGDQYWEIVVSYNGVLERYCRGNWQKVERRMRSMEAQARRAARDVEGDAEECCDQHDQHENQHDQHDQHTSKRCPICGSPSFQKFGKTASGLQRFRCNGCGKTFVLGAQVADF